MQPPTMPTSRKSDPDSRPLVAVGLAVYNAERYVAQAIESLLGQTFRDFELIISDNASTDASGEICRRYADQDGRIRYHRNDTNIGMARNYNLLFEMSDSKYFRWATADDYTTPTMLAASVEIMEKDPSLSLCYSRAVFVDPEGRELARWQDDLHLLDDDPSSRFRTVVNQLMKVHHHLGLMRSDCMRRTGLIGSHTSSDKAFVAEMSLYGRFHQIPEYHFYRREHEDSSSWATLDDAHQARRYHASGVNRVRFKMLRYHWAFVQAVHRSPLRSVDRARLYGFLLERAYGRRRILGGELLRELHLRGARH
jgi:glycosyltransferase involved in cell wall biosynthesis